MKPVRILTIGALGTALALGAFGVFQGLPDSSFKPSKEINAYGLVGGDKVQATYEKWAERHEADGGNRNLMIALGPVWGHANEARAATGSVKVDVTEGKVAARVAGLAADAEWDLWLVDDAPDRPDRSLRVGRLEREDGATMLSAKLGPGALRDFQIDKVAVARAGEDPSNAAVSGSASLFQRLYTALESEEMLFASDFSHLIEKREPGSGPALLTVRTAMASHLDPIHVDGDVIFDSLVRDGADLFINEQFNGNGRTCATCHPALNNFTIDVSSIGRLKDDDALFVAEFIPALAANFEKPALMRGAALILENVDGMDDLANKFVMRGVPHTLGLSVSLTPPNIPFDNSAPPNTGFPPGFPAQRTGWGGDGAPNAGSLRDFATGAVNQHFPLSLGRVDGVDFRLPDPDELDAMEAFQLALGRNTETDITTISFRNPRATLGVELFNRLDTGNPPGTPCVGGMGAGCPPLPAGKCAICHENAGANITGSFFSPLLGGAPVSGNANFGTGVNGLSSPPADLIDPANNPRDGGFGIIPHDGVTPLPQIGNVPCVPPFGGFGVVTLPGGALPPGLCEEDFNTVSLVEAADTRPFFHNNAVDTLESAIGFYNDDAFNDAPGGQLAAALDTNGVGIRIDASEVTAIGAMLRVLNALENIRSIRELGAAAIFTSSNSKSRELMDVAIAECLDGLAVLDAADLHPVAVDKFFKALGQFAESQFEIFDFARRDDIQDGLDLIDDAEADMIVP